MEAESNNLGSLHLWSDIKLYTVKFSLKETVINLNNLINHKSLCYKMVLKNFYDILPDSMLMVSLEGSLIISPEFKTINYQIINQV